MSDYRDAYEGAREDLLHWRKRAQKAEARIAELEAERDKWKRALEVQSWKLQSVLHIPGVRAALKGDEDTRAALKEGGE